MHQRSPVPEPLGMLQVARADRSVQLARPSGAAASILALQRHAGNAAVASLIASGMMQPAMDAPPVQRKIIELWNVAGNAPNKRPLNAHAQTASQHWGGYSQESATPIVRALITHLMKVSELTQIVTSGTPNRMMFDHFTKHYGPWLELNWVWAIHNFIEGGGTRQHVRDLEFSVLEVNGANLDTIGNNAVLRWNKWYEYKPENYIARHDPELAVIVAGRTWGLIHPHYKPNMPLVEANMDACHLKRPFGDARFQIAAAWHTKAHDVVAADGGARPT